MYYEINPIRFDSIEINCQKIYDSIIACEIEFENNKFFNNNLQEVLTSIMMMLYEVNEVEVFYDMVDLILRFKNKIRELTHIMRFIDDKDLKSSDNLSYVICEMNKFNEIL